MKKLFMLALCVFIASLTGFFVTAGALGRRGYNGVYSTIYESNSSSAVFRGDYCGSNSWRVVNNFPYVNINSAGVNTVIGRSSSEFITIALDNPKEKNVHVEAVYQDNTLTIEVRPTNITFDLDNIRFGIISWLEDVFSGTSDITLMIGFPETIYDSIHIQQGSGSIQVNDLFSRNYNIDIGSGRCEFSRETAADFKSGTFYLNLGSGSVVINGMETDSFDIDIGSGSFNISRLCGNGKIDMGSGKGSISFGQASKSTVDMGSGMLDLYYPTEGGLTLGADIGSGSISINAYNTEKKFTLNDDADEVILGDGSSTLKIDMGSGKINILDNSAYTPAEVISAFKEYADTASADRGFSSAEEVNGVLIVDGIAVSSTSSLAAVDIPNITIEAPDAPKAPEAPDAPKAPEAPDAPKAPEATGSSVSAA